MRKYGKPFGDGADTHLMFEHRTEVNVWLSLNPRSFSKMNNGQMRIFDRNKYRYGTHHNNPKQECWRWHRKKKQSHRHEKILQLRERGDSNYEAQIDVLALAPQQKV